MKRNSKILINGRFYRQRLTGVQRYASEVVRQLGTKAKLIVPPQNPLLSRSPIWEQFVLPLRIRQNKLLWSPTNTGPISITNQVVTIHDISPLDHPEWFNPIFSTWYRFMLPRLAKCVKKIITDSNFTRRRCIQALGIEDTRIEVINLGVSQSFHPTTQSEVINLRKRIHLEQPYLLSLGSIEPRKNQKRLLQAWALIRSKMQKIELAIAGDIGYPFRDPELGELPKGVRLLGRIPEHDLPALYSGALALVYPSLYEGFGLPPLEAMACGTPVIASNTTSLPEVVGEAGLLIDPLNISDIASAMEQVIMDSELRTKLREKGFRRAKLFSWEKTAQQVWDVLCQAAQEDL